MLYRLSSFQDGDWVRARYTDTFTTEVMDNGVRRLRCTTSGDTAAFFRQLTTRFAPPYFLLYVLHTPRTDAEPGRYQSGSLSADGLREFVAVFADFLSGDGRHDLWSSAPNDGAQVVWTRHDTFYIYGPLAGPEAFVRSRGFQHGSPDIPSPHAHNYHPEFDDAERRLLSYDDWLKTPLRPDDDQ